MKTCGFPSPSSAINLHPARFPANWGKRLGDQATAHHRSIFLHVFRPGYHPIRATYVHFEALCVKKSTP